MPHAIAGILANFGLIVAGAFTRWVSYGLAKDNEVLSLQVSGRPPVLLCMSGWQGQGVGLASVIVSTFKLGGMGRSRLVFLQRV